MTPAGASITPPFLLAPTTTGAVVVGVILLAIGVTLLAVGVRAAWTARRPSPRTNRHDADPGPGHGLGHAPRRAAAASAIDAEFVIRMGHELRTPLNSVIGFSSVLLKNPSGNFNAQQLLYLTRIRDNGVHLLALIDHLLAVSDGGTGAQRVHLTPVSVGRLVRGTLEELACEAAEDDVKVETQVPNDLLPLTTDEHRFQLALRSLVRGALPLAGHGNMTVRVAAPDGRPQRIDLDITAPAGTRNPDDLAPAASIPAEITLATSLYHLLGYPVTTEPALTGSGSTISVKLEPETAPASAPASGV